VALTVPERPPAMLMPSPAYSPAAKAVGPDEVALALTVPERPPVTVIPPSGA